MRVLCLYPESMRSPNSRAPALMEEVAARGRGAGVEFMQVNSLPDEATRYEAICVPCTGETRLWLGGLLKALEQNKPVLGIVDVTAWEKREEYEAQSDAFSSPERAAEWDALAKEVDQNAQRLLLTQAAVVLVSTRAEATALCEKFGADRTRVEVVGEATRENMNAWLKTAVPIAFDEMDVLTRALCEITFFRELELERMTATVRGEAQQARGLEAQVKARAGVGK